MQNWPATWGRALRSAWQDQVAGFSRLKWRAEEVHRVWRQMSFKASVRGYSMLDIS